MRSNQWAPVRMCPNFALIASIVLPSAAVAQQQAPSPDQAPSILSSLDTDSDKKISENEAQGALKQNFSFIDSNGDGGIDLVELTTILETVSSQRGGGAAAGASAATSSPASGAPVFDAPAFDALTAKFEALAASGKLSQAESMQLYKMVADAVVEEQQRYFSVQKNTVHDHQRHVHGPNVLHVVTSLKLGANADLIETMKEYKRVLEELGGEVVYVGKTAFAGLASKQLAESQWDVFAVLQLNSREQWNELTASAEYKEMLSAFETTYSLGLNRDSLENLRMPANLLATRIQQTLNHEPKRLPFQRVPDESAAAKQQAQLFAELAAEHAAYSEDAIVIVNFQKFGEGEQVQANASYGNEMMALFAEGGHGPLHVGQAVKLEGDAEFDVVVLVYYPGVKYFGDMVGGTFYTGIRSNKQLGDTLSSVTVPILQLL